MSGLGYLGVILIGTALALVVTGLAGRRRGPALPPGLGYAPGRREERALGPLGRLGEAAVQGRDLGPRLARDLDRAGIGASPAEFAGLVIGGAGGLGLLFGVLSGSALLGIVAAAAGAAGARLFVRLRARRWLVAFEEQLPEAFDLLAGSLEAGSSLAQAMELVAAEGEPPLSEELRQVLAETRLGVPLAEALQASAVRVGSRDYGWCVQAVKLQQDFGASLAGVLRTLAEFMRWRDELKREVSALTAEGRISAWVLIALPFAVSGFFMLTNPSYLGLLTATPMGWGLLALAGGLMAIGSIWMMRLVKVEV
jgi:tight adherence protein B